MDEEKKALKSPEELDLLMAHHAHRKCDDIINKTMQAFIGAVKEWGTISLDEVLGIGIALAMHVCVEVWEEHATDREKVRKELAQVFAMWIERGTEEGQ